MKIAIIGYSGSGKSTLAKQCSNLLNIPCCHYDKIQFIENWKERSQEDKEILVEESLNQKSWIIDGNYFSFQLDRRLEDADKIVYMNYPRRICLIRAFNRYFQNRGKSRDSITEGCIEKIDIEFIMWILFNGRNKKIRNLYKNIQKKYHHKFIECKNDNDTKKFLNTI